MDLLGPDVPGRPVCPVCQALGKPVDEREPGVYLDRESPVRRREKHPSPDTQGLGDEPALLLARADVLDHGVREHNVELAVAEREVERIPLDVADRRVADAEARSVVQAARGDPIGPGMERLEEVERRAPGALAEPELV